MSSQLVPNIYKVLEDGKEVTQDQADTFGKTLSDLIAGRLKERTEGERKFTLRMSNIGKGARQLWYAKRFPPETKLQGHTLLKFIIGDITEVLLLFLARLAGHNVSQEQAEVAIGGVKGHIDADIDGTTVDVKSASTFSFKKFQDKELLQANDSFGYIEQIAGYSKARGTDGAFLALDKQNGHIAYLPFSKEELSGFKVEDRIEYLKEAVESDVEPERCYPDEKMGESGNRKLGVNCSYCDFKKRCWKDSNGGLGLRTFLYASGPVFLTNVANEPKVHEVTF